MVVPPLHRPFISRLQSQATGARPGATAASDAPAVAVERVGDGQSDGDERLAARGRNEGVVLPSAGAAGRVEVRFGVSEGVKTVGGGVENNAGGGFGVAW